MRLPPMPSPRDILNLYKIACRKQLSQNMLLDNKIASKLVRTGKKVKNSYVVEVGPGAGSLTRCILQQNSLHCAVIEKDPRFLPSLNMLREVVGSNKMSIHLGDILHFNMSDILPHSLSLPWQDPRTPQIHIVGNLPFNVATPLIFKWLKDISLKQNAWKYGRVSMTLTLQDEVAKSTTAKSGDLKFRLVISFFS